MADGKNPGNATAQSSDLVDTVGTLGTNLARVGAMVVSLPFYILPAKERDDAISATTQLFTAVGDLHLSLLRGAVHGVGIAARGLASATGADGAAPHVTVTKVPIESATTATR